MEKLNDIIGLGRRNATEMLDELMDATFDAINEALEEWKKMTGEVFEPTRGICGLSAITLKEIATHSEDDSFLEFLHGPDRSRILMEFLNINRLRMEEIRMKYPNAYVKWDAEQDARLLEERRDGASLKHLALSFGRNENAIKIRLERLGAGDAETADASYRYPAHREWRPSEPQSGGEA